MDTGAAAAAIAKNCDGCKTRCSHFCLASNKFYKCINETVGMFLNAANNKKAT